MEEGGEEQTEVFMPCEIMEELHEMQESYPSCYKYPKFEGMDDAEVCIDGAECIVLTN